MKNFEKNMANVFFCFFFDFAIKSDFYLNMASRFGPDEALNFLENISQDDSDLEDEISDGNNDMVNDGYDSGSYFLLVSPLRRYSQPCFLFCLHINAVNSVAMVIIIIKTFLYIYFFSYSERLSPWLKIIPQVHLCISS